MHVQSGAGDWSLASTLSAGGATSCLAALRGGSHVAAGGEGREVAVWDVATGQKLFAAKPPAKDWLGMYVRIHCASAAFTGGDGAHATLAVGGEHEVRLFDFRAQRRPVRTFALGEKGLVTALAPSPDGCLLVAGSTRGLLSQFDVGTGRTRGALKGCSGAVRALSQHPTLPLVAATGLDRHVRVFSTASRLQELALYVKQPCTGIVFDACTGASLTTAAAAAAAAAAEPPAAAPKPRKDRRTTAVMEAMARAAQGEGEEEAAPPPRRRKKARGADGLMLNLVE